MQIVNKTELKLQSYEKCSIVCDNDCSLGMIYDYVCAVQSYIVQKMNEAQQKNDQQKEESKENPEG